MRIEAFRLTRFEFPRDRVVGDSQVEVDEVHLAALELIDGAGNVGLGFAQSLFHPFPAEGEIERLFATEAWHGLEGQPASAIVHAVRRPRGGNLRRMTLPFEEAIQQAAWDLLAKQAGLPLWQMLGARRKCVPAYASGLDYHLSDNEFQAFFARAAGDGYRAFKIKVGHPELERDIHRLDLLKKAVGTDVTIMVDANEAWSAKVALRSLAAMEAAGHDIFWVEDPVLRNDFDGLRLIQANCQRTLVNAGEYLDLSGKRALLQAGALDMLNVHGNITDVMRIGWLAADMGVPISLGNSFLEIGLCAALALPDTNWIEYSYQNFDHLVEKTFEVRDGQMWASDAPGHGLTLLQSLNGAQKDRRQPRDTQPATAAHGR